MKVWLTTAAVILAVLQVITATRIYEKLRFPPEGRFYNFMHRTTGFLAIGLSLPVAYHCIFLLGYASISDTRTLIHAILGTFVYGVFVAKIFVVALPVASAGAGAADPWLAALHDPARPLGDVFAVVLLEFGRLFLSGADHSSASGSTRVTTPGICASTASSQRPPAAPSPNSSSVASSNRTPPTNAAHAAASHAVGIATSPERCSGRTGSTRRRPRPRWRRARRTRRRRWAARRFVPARAGAQDAFNIRLRAQLANSLLMRLFCAHGRRSSASK